MPDRGRTLVRPDPGSDRAPRQAASVAVFPDDGHGALNDGYPAAWRSAGTEQPFGWRGKAMTQNDDVATQIGTDPAVDLTGDPNDNESYHGYSVDDETQPQSTGDSLVAEDRGIVDPMDEGWNPPEKWSAAQGYGNTPLEESMGESLEQRLRQEVPEDDPYEQAEAEAGRGELSALVTEDPTGSQRPDQEVGDRRSGRIVAPDEGAGADTEATLVARDVGIDGAAATAEEAAVHVIPDETR
jgi:hypothetical protein